MAWLAGEWQGCNFGAPHESERGSATRFYYVHRARPGREGQSRQIPAACPRRSAICVRGLFQVSRGFLCFFPRLSTPPFFNIYPVCCISVDYRRSVFSYTVLVFVCMCTRLFKKNCWDAVCACASWCQIDPNVRFHFKVACGQTNGYKVVHRRKGKSVHTCIMYVYVSMF